MGIQARHNWGAAETEPALANTPRESAVTTRSSTCSADEEQGLADEDPGTQLSISICNTSFFSFCKIQEDDIMVSSSHTSLKNLLSDVLYKERIKKLFSLS